MSDFGHDKFSERGAADREAVGSPAVSDTTGTADDAPLGTSQYGQAGGVPKPLTMLEASARLKAAWCRLGEQIVRKLPGSSFDPVADRMAVAALEADVRAEEYRREVTGEA